MASDLNLDAIEQRANAATKEPWDVKLGHSGSEMFWFLVRPDHDGIRAWTDQDHIDFDFAAHARTDIPALIARVRELEASLAKVDADCDMIIRWIDTRQLDNDALRTLCHLMKDTAKGLADAN